MSCKVGTVKLASVSEARWWSADGGGGGGGGGGLNFELHAISYKQYTYSYVAAAWYII